MGSSVTNRRHHLVPFRQESQILVSLHLHSPTALPLITSLPSYQSAALGRVVFIQREWTVLQYAVWSGYYNLVEELITAGCDPYQPNKSGETALSLAQELNDQRMLSLLQGSTLIVTSLSPLETQPNTVKHNNYVQPETHVTRW
jgi:hypothetical protein